MVEQLPPLSRRNRSNRVNNGLLIPATATLAFFSAVDAFVPWDQGQSDPARRQLVDDMLGHSLTESTGNVIFAAAASIVLTTLVKILQYNHPHSSPESHLDDYYRHLQIGVIALLVAGVCVIEGFTDNNQFIQDNLARLGGIGAGVGITSELAHRLRLFRQQNVREPGQVDRLFPDPVPTLFARVGTSADQIFPDDASKYNVS